MSRTMPLQRSWDKGVRRDTSRNAMPAGSAWDMVDLVLGPEGLRERGGYTYASNDIAAVKATASYVASGFYAPFKAAAKNLAIDEDGELYVIAANGTVTDVGAAQVPGHLPYFMYDQVIIPDAAGTTAPKSYNGTAISALGGSPPAGRYGCLFRDHAVLAGSNANDNRIWFSETGNPASWPTAAWVDMDNVITGLAPMRGGILVFTDTNVERLRGSNPPGTTQSDFAHDMLGVGGAYPGSIQPIQDNVLWCNPDSVFMSDGSGLYDLGFDSGLKPYWQDLMAGDTGHYSWTVAAGVLRQRYYVISILNASGTLQNGIVLDVPLKRWWRWTNIDARTMWSYAGRLFFGRRGAPRVGELSSTFEKASGVKADADGDVVVSVLETSYYEADFRLKCWRNLYPTFDLRDAATDNPTVQVAYVLSPESTSYTNLGSALGESSAEIRQQLPINLNRRGLAFKLTRANAAADFRLYGLDADVYAMEGSKVA